MTQITSGRRLRLLALGLAVTLLVALVALASRSSAIPGGDGRANAGPVIAILHLVEIIAIAVELLALLLLIVILRLARGRHEEDEDQQYREPRRLPWWARVLIVVLPLLQVAAVMFALYRVAGEPQELAPANFAPTRPVPGGFIEQVGANLGLAWWEILIAVALAAAAFIAIIRAFREPPPVSRRESEPPRDTHALASAVAAGLRDARREPDPRRAVIAAYATMEQMLAAQGLPRRAVEAPLEYMGRLFAQLELEISAEAMQTLTDLFELARFSHHAISPAAKERAIAALQIIENDLDVQMAR